MSLPPELAALLAAALPDGIPVTPATLADAPQTAGAYLLLLALDHDLQVVRPRPARLPPGIWLYAGSARGPGGIRARIAVHFRSRRRPHWHIDQLTAAAATRAAIALPAMVECAIVDRLGALPGFTQPLPGFGSSDCRFCPSHLLACRGWSRFPVPVVSPERDSL